MEPCATPSRLACLKLPFPSCSPQPLLRDFFRISRHFSARAALLDHLRPSGPHDPMPSLVACPSKCEGVPEIPRTAPGGLYGNHEISGPCGLGPCSGSASAGGGGRTG